MLFVLLVRVMWGGSARDVFFGAELMSLMAIRALTYPLDQSLHQRKKVRLYF